MHVTFDSLKTFYNILVQKLKNHRGNWNQNDPAADDYIKNRPFYSKVENVVILPETTITVEEPFTEIWNQFQLSLNKGQTYTVVFDGKVYQCTAKETYDDEPFIGNSSILGWNDNRNTGEPFFIDVWMGDGVPEVCFATNVAGSHTISISTVQEVVKKLDKKFIDMPDDIVTDEKFDELRDTVDDHIYDINNPHDVTAGQIGAAPMSHASVNTTYGLGNSNLYGHVKLSDSTNSTEGSANGIAATPKAVSAVYSLATNHANNKSNPHGITINQIGAASESHTHSYLRYLNTTAKMPINTAWKSIAYGNGKFVAVGGTYPTYYAAYSSEGITWNITTLPKYIQPRSIAYGNGKFVVVEGWDTYSDIHYAAYSSDGITWNTTTLPKDIQTSCIAYGNGKFVAIESGTDKAIYSSDGITWNETTLPSSGAWSSIAYGNGKFVAIESGSDKVIYSSDGITWNETTLLNNLRASYITYGGDKFVVVSDFESCRSAYSTDGITWNEAVFSSNSASAEIVTYGDGKFVALGSSAYYSLDGITWNRSDSPIHGSYKSVTYGNGRFVTVPRSSDIVFYSEDGINWKREYTGVMQDDISVDLGIEEIYKQPEEPTEAPEGALWVDTDEESASGGSSMPDVSGAPEGAFLRVVNGVAAWSAAPNAEEATF